MSHVVARNAPPNAPPPYIRRDGEPLAGRARSNALSSFDSKPPKIAQPHGGALYSGGVPGNRGGGRPRSVATLRAGETLEDVVRRIGQVIERRPDTCPHCGGAVEVMPELSLAEYARILRTLAGIVFSEPAVDEPIQVNVVAPAGHIPSEAAQ